jgi:hypothetical protein
VIEGPVLCATVSATFRNWNTRVEPIPAGFTEAFSVDPAKSNQWTAFIGAS